MPSGNWRFLERGKGEIDYLCCLGMIDGFGWVLHDMYSAFFGGLELWRRDDVP